MKVSVEVPASSANLGPGFDALALALDLPLRVHVETVQRGPTTLTVAGEGADRLSADKRNRFMIGLTRGLAAVGTPASGQGPWRIEMDNRIPLMRGLGSSAAASVAGLVAAAVLNGVELAQQQLIALATEIEGHPDNAAAALLGGFVVVSRGRVARFDPPASLRAVVFVPQRPLRTAQMREVLPASVPLQDAVQNIGATALIVAAVAGGDLSLLSAMNDDRLHERQRAAVYQELPLLLAAAREAGALGAALSGAGSTVIALCDGDGPASAVSAAFEAAARHVNLAGAAQVLGVSASGARVVG